MDHMIKDRQKAKRLPGAGNEGKTPYAEWAESSVPEGSLDFAKKVLVAIPEPLVVIDEKLYVIWANRSFYRLFQVSPEKTIGRQLCELGNGRWNLPALRQWLQDRFISRDKTDQYFEVRHEFPAIGRKIMLLRARKLEHKNGKPAMLLLLIEEVTRQKDAEEALQRDHELLGREIKECTADLAEANRKLLAEIEEREKKEQELRESSEKMKLFAYSVLHDLKSPTVGLCGLTKLLFRQYRDKLDERGKTYCKEISRVAEEIAALVEMINVYISTKETPLKIEPVDLKGLVQKVKNEFSEHLLSRGIQFKESEHFPEIMADSMAVMRILRNLVDNSLKYGGDGLSTITIAYQDTDDFHILSVGDDGAGLSKESCEKIFEPFNRESTAQGKSGAGLGLTIVKESAEQLGGSVSAEPGKDSGVSFNVKISKKLHNLLVREGTATFF